jgi:hypothetical protein
MTHMNVYSGVLKEVFFRSNTQRHTTCIAQNSIKYEHMNKVCQIFLCSKWQHWWVALREHSNIRQFGAKRKFDTVPFTVAYWFVIYVGKKGPIAKFSISGRNINRRWDLDPSLRARNITPKSQFWKSRGSETKSNVIFEGQNHIGYQSNYPLRICFTKQSGTYFTFRFWNICGRAFVETDHLRPNKLVLNLQNAPFDTASSAKRLSLCLTCQHVMKTRVGVEEKFHESLTSAPDGPGPSRLALTYGAVILESRPGDRLSSLWVSVVLISFSGQVPGNYPILENARFLSHPFQFIEYW